MIFWGIIAYLVIGLGVAIGALICGTEDQMFLTWRDLAVFLLIIVAWFVLAIILMWQWISQWQFLNPFYRR